MLNTSNENCIFRVLLVNIFLLCSFLLVTSVQAQQVKASVAEQTSSIMGLWTTKEEDGVFNIYSCGQGICGRFVGIQYTTPLPPTNKYGRSQCNFLMLRNFVLDDTGKRWFGKIFDPRNEKGYSAKIWLSGSNELRVRGYMGISLFGETHIWHRFTGKIFSNCFLPEIKINN